MDTPYTTSLDVKLGQNVLHDLFQDWKENGAETFSKEQIQDEYNTLLEITHELLQGFREKERHEPLDEYQERKEHFEQERFRILREMIKSDVWYAIDEDNKGLDSCNRISLSFQPVRIVAEFYGVDVGALP